MVDRHIDKSIPHTIIDVYIMLYILFPHIQLKIKNTIPVTGIAYMKHNHLCESCGAKVITKAKTIVAINHTNNPDKAAMKKCLCRLNFDIFFCFGCI